MNLTEIDNVAQLVLANEQSATPTERALNALKDVDYDDTLNIIKWLVTNMKDFHHTCAAKKMEEGDVENLAAWVYDEAKLDIVLKALEDIN